MILNGFKYFMQCLIISIFSTIGLANENKQVVVDKSYENQVFEQILAEYADMTYEQLKTRIPKRAYKDRLTFDPLSVKFYDSVAKKMELNQEEIEIFKRNGFVSVDHDQRFSFGSAYFAIYTRDLPVFITTDSILHAMHRSYDEILKELEETLFTFQIDEILSKAHSDLFIKSARYTNTSLTKHFKDVDLYMTVARNLLAGAGAKVNIEKSDNLVGKFGLSEDYNKLLSQALLNGSIDESEISSIAESLAGISDVQDMWDGKLIVHSKFAQDEKVLEVLNLVASLGLQSPVGESMTSIYGGERDVDYSQFKPRGHYTKSIKLRRYFRCMMWLGRADCGWNIIPDNPEDTFQADRELRDAILLTETLVNSKSMGKLKAMDDIIAFMVGNSDNFSPFSMVEVLEENNIKNLADVERDQDLKKVRRSVESNKFANQRIRSQLVVSDPHDTIKVPPPSLFQMFGQRFVIDSFILSQVVFDSIIFKDKKIKRFMPMGLDVMAALGNNEAVFLLSVELKRWNYSANLFACSKFVNRQLPAFWEQNLYNLWLHSLRTIDDDMTIHKNFPQVLSGKAWQMKQLQTQLSSWAELRHDTILYAKQSYTAFVACEYPTGYIAPYPYFYEGIKYFADKATRLFAAADYSSNDKKRDKILNETKKRQISFFKQMSSTLGKLKELADKELAGKPFKEEDKQFIKKTIDIKGGGSGPPRYDGWYCNLFYNRGNHGGMLASKWDPTISDVHTDTNTKKALEVGVGNVNFCVIAIDNENDKAVYVGPIYSYYEFHQNAENRLTDEEWQEKILSGKLPPRPEWTRIFQGPVEKRSLK